MENFIQELSPSITKIATEVYEPIYLNNENSSLTATLYKGNPLYDTLNINISLGKLIISGRFDINLIMLKVLTQKLKNSGYTFSNENEFEMWVILINTEENEIIFKNYLNK